MSPSDGGASPAETARLSAVRRVLDAPAEGALGDVVRVAALALGTPIASVSLVDAGTVWFAAAHGLGALTTAGTDPGLCASAIEADGVYVVSDAVADPRALAHPLVRGAFGLRFYAAAPVVAAGHRLGTVNVMDRTPRTFDDVQAGLLLGLAAIVARLLELRLEARTGSATWHDTVPPPTGCRLGGAGAPCDRPAELKLADPWGDSAWGCADHVEEALLHARGAFLADRDLGVLRDFMDRR